MRIKRIIFVGAGLVWSTLATADQPLAVPVQTVCSLSGRFCVTREAVDAVVWRKRPGGGRETLWRAPTRGTNLQIADDGRSLVEVQPWANLIERDAGPTTTMFTFFRPNSRPVRISLGELIRDVPALPVTVSHRRWASTFGYDGRGHFEVDTVENRRILFDPNTGRPVPR